jgi:nitrogen regulatory protein P-II 1
MREIKAFIRVNMVTKVIQALEAAGITNITVIDVRAIWTGLKGTRDVHYSIELAERYMNVAKLETLVRDEDADRVVELIRRAARTGRPGGLYAARQRGSPHPLGASRRGPTARADCSAVMSAWSGTIGLVSCAAWVKSLADPASTASAWDRAHRRS